jgi:precorrin-2 dehydrogenase/sirohydrochlorin ferrochelatase
MSHAYPIFLDVSRRRMVIVGGGAVAARKASGLLAAGGKAIKAIAPKFVRDFPREVEKITAGFAPVHLDGAEMVFAATDSTAVNDAVAAEARRRGIWLHRADGEEDDPGDFITPAVLRCGPITVAVSASGSPALAAGLRDALAGSVTNDWVELAEALKQLRPRIKASGLPIARRGEILRSAASTEAAAALAEGGMAGLNSWLRKRFADLPELGDGTPSAGGAQA